MALWPDGSEDEETFQWREDLRRQVEEVSNSSVSSVTDIDTLHRTWSVRFD